MEPDELKTSIDKYITRYDLSGNSPVSNCSLTPSEIDQKVFPWLYTRNNKYGDESSIDSEKVGKWMLFVPKTNVDSVWNKIKAATANGDLWNCKVSTVNSENPARVKNHVIIVYTKDYTDVDDVVRVLDYLETSGLKSKDSTIRYKTDQQTHAGIYRGGNQRPWIYSSDTIRKPSAAASSKQNSITKYFKKMDG